LHHRSPEPDALVDQRLAHRQADPDRHRTSLSGDEHASLLRGNSAVHGVDDTVEHGHHPVAGVLHLGSVVVCKRGAKDREVLVPDVVPGPFSEPAEMLGRSNDVAEQHRDRRAPPYRAHRGQRAHRSTTNGTAPASRWAMSSAESVGRAWMAVM
jgi:hypothetical protein